MIDSINILPVGLRDKEEVIAYVLKTREQLFPMLDHKVIPRDLQEFSSTYVETDLGVFLQARTGQGELIGTIGMMVYNDRFPYFSFTATKIVEIVKLFIEPAYRRSGLATRLVHELKKISQKQGVELLYLHTHPFLTGAYEFWLKQGFDLMLSREESGFETLHMTLDKTKVIKTDTFNSFMENC